MEGIGDAIKKVTEFLGIEQCPKCIERQGKFNRWFPFKNPIHLNDDEVLFLDNFFNWYNGLPLPIDKIDEVLKAEQIWLRVFRVKTGACKSCGSGYQNNYIKDLRKLWEVSKEFI